jgi:NAD-dependent dihydropyrimidine dehydrogenase PreA subunit
MFIDQELCEKCLDCRPVCPMGAIVVKEKNVVIDYEDCVECGVCLRFNICPTGAIKQVDEIPYPRVIRAVFSDVVATHANTGIAGRGTEEMKTNDVTNLFVEGEIGFSIELGRPGVGAYLSELEKVVRKVVSLGVILAPDNPVYPLIVDKAVGNLRPEVLKEKVLSAIVEFIVKEERALKIVDEMQHFLNKELDTVATMSVIARAEKDGKCSFLDKLTTAGQKPYPNGKVNIGMALV